MNKTPKTDAKKAAARIDWAAIHARLEGASAAIEQKSALTEGARKKILKTRAQALAQEPRAIVPEGAQIEIVSFLLAYENYAFESSFVREIHPLKHLCPLPGTPSFVAGIISVRRQIVSVVDLKKFFELPDKGLTDLNKVIILQDGKNEFGILADTLLGVSHLPVVELQPSLPTLTGIRARYLRGITRDRLAVLDAAKLLTDPKINNCQTNKTPTPTETP